VTLDKIRTRKPTKRQRDEIAALAALPDDRIDLSDIPEITGNERLGAESVVSTANAFDHHPIEWPDIEVAQASFKVEGVAVSDVY